MSAVVNIFMACSVAFIVVMPFLWSIHSATKIVAKVAKPKKRVNVVESVMKVTEGLEIEEYSGVTSEVKSSDPYNTADSQTNARRH